MLQLRGLSGPGERRICHNKLRVLLEDGLDPVPRLALEARRPRGCRSRRRCEGKRRWKGADWVDRFRLTPPCPQGKMASLGLLDERRDFFDPALHLPRRFERFLPLSGTQGK